MFCIPADQWTDEDVVCTWVTMQLIHKAAMRLDECRMIRFEVESESFGVTDLGRVASHFYIQVRECFCVVFERLHIS